MSCMLIAPDSEDSCTLPIDPDEMEEMRRTGWEIMRGILGGDPGQSRQTGKQYIGAAARPDGRPYYLTIVSPEGDPKADDWSGAFYAPFGFFYVCGSVTAKPESDASSSLTVKAKLVAGGRDLIAANWTIAGPRSTIRSPNKAGLITAVEVTASGPHERDDIRNCILRHAPAVVWGVPRAVVSCQCGVAAACLIEAYC